MRLRTRKAEDRLIIIPYEEKPGEALRLNFTENLDLDMCGILKFVD